MTPQNVQLSRQRSQALYSMCCEGEIVLDTILAIPIDWQSVAMQYELGMNSAIAACEEPIPSLTPLYIKYGPRPRQDTGRKYPSPSEPTALESKMDNVLQLSTH